MPQGHESLIYFGLFLFFLALALFVPALDSMLINVAEASDNVQTLFKLAFTVIAFGFLIGGAVGHD